MKSNTILKSAVILALGYGGAALAQGASDVARPAANGDDSPAADSTGYQPGHASAGQSLPSHPGAGANDSGAAGVSAAGELEQGHASAQETMRSDGMAAGMAMGASALASMSTKDLVDKPVKHAAGDEVGTIKAIVTDKTAAAHGYAVIEFGGTFGIGEKQVIVGLDQLQVSADGSIEMLESDENDFGSYPVYVASEYDTYEGQMAKLL